MNISMLEKHMAILQTLKKKQGNLPFSRSCVETALKQVLADVDISCSFTQGFAEPDRPRHSHQLSLSRNYNQKIEAPEGRGGRLGVVRECWLIVGSLALLDARTCPELRNSLVFSINCGKVCGQYHEGTQMFRGISNLVRVFLYFLEHMCVDVTTSLNSIEFVTANAW